MWQEGAGSQSLDPWGSARCDSEPASDPAAGSLPFSERRWAGEALSIPSQLISCPPMQSRDVEGGKTQEDAVATRQACPRRVWIGGHPHQPPHTLPLRPLGMCCITSPPCGPMNYRCAVVPPLISLFFKDILPSWSVVDLFLFFLNTFPPLRPVVSSGTTTQLGLKERVPPALDGW